MEQLIEKIRLDVEALLSEIGKTDNKAAKARTRKRSIELEKHLKEYRKASLG